MKPKSIPTKAINGGFDFSEIMAYKTSHNGKIAPIMAPKPAGINLTPQVLSPLLNIKLRKARIKSEGIIFFFW